MLAGVNPDDSADDVCVRLNKVLPCALHRFMCTAAVSVCPPVVFSCFAASLGSHSRFFVLRVIIPIVVCGTFGR